MPTLEIGGIFFAVEAPARHFLFFGLFLGVLLAGGVVFFSAMRGDPVGPLFHYILTGPVIFGLIGWALSAAAARRFFVGKWQKNMLPASKAALYWGGSRLVLLLASFSVMVCWLVALALGLAVASAILKVGISLIVVTAFAGIIGGAILNSLIVVKRWRGHGTN